jgi:hypothetical protein
MAVPLQTRKLTDTYLKQKTEPLIKCNTIYVHHRFPESDTYGVYLTTAITAPLIYA